MRAGQRFKTVDNGKLGTLIGQVRDGKYAGEWNCLFDSGTEGIIKADELVLIEIDTPTLRDQFAMAAIPALLADRDSPAVYLADVAKAAYDLADAMLAAREAK